MRVIIAAATCWIALSAADLALFGGRMTEALPRFFKAVLAGF